MTEKSSKRVWWLVAFLLAVQAVMVAGIVHRESLTFDEDDHMFAGYMMWHTGDYGLNPEHPPLVKLLATVPLLGRNLWVPELKPRDFKLEAYLDGRDWLARNDGDRNQLVFQMRLMAGLVALALTLVIFLAAREWFGETAGVIALIIAVFEPNFLGHSALVTTDAGVTLFFLASVYTFWRWVDKPSVLRLLIAGVTAGLLLATKHSGILLAPMLIVLAVWEVTRAERSQRGRTTARMAGGLASIVVVGVVVLWAFYGFRYAARPDGLALSTSLVDYTKPLSPFSAGVVLWFAKWHLLPESYLMGLTDVKRMAQFYPTFIFGKVYAHGQWWYFPAVMLIKTTLGLIAMTAVGIWAMATGKLKQTQALVYLGVPSAVYLAVAIVAGMNIGARHILPLYAFGAIFAGGAMAAMAKQGRRWVWVAVALVAAHGISSMTSMPNPIAYANEAWGGSGNTYKLLSDANTDWAQQLFQVKSWIDKHPGEECYFAYFANPEVDPAVYGIHCHMLPTADTFWMGGAEHVPAKVTGNLLISAGDLSGCEWPSSGMNPYLELQSREPDAKIDNGVLVYRGTFDLHKAGALARAETALRMGWGGKAADGLPLAREAAAMDPEGVMSQTAHGDAAAAAGLKDEARAAWQAALANAHRLEPDAQVSYVPDLEQKLNHL